MKLVYIISFSIWLVACHSDQPMEHYSDIEKISIHLHETENILPMSEYFSEIKYLPLIVSSGQPIGNLTKIIVKNDFYALYDRSRNSAWLFDFDGIFIREIRIPQGGGPGELNHMTDLLVTDNQRVFALGAHKIVEYDMEEKFVDEVNFDYFAYNFTYDSVNDLFITSAENDLNLTLESKHAGNNLIYLNRNGEITDSRLPIPAGREFIRQVPPNRFPLFEDIELYSPHLVDTIYAVNQSDIEPRYILDFGDASATDDVFSQRSNYGSSLYDWAGFYREELQGGGFVFVIQVFNETNNFIHLRFGAGDNYYNTFYNKHTGESRTGPARLTNDIDYGIAPFIYQGSDDALMALLQPGELIDHVEHYREHFPEKYNSLKMKNLIALTDTLERYGNPVLKIAKFK